MRMKNESNLYRVINFLTPLLGLFILSLNILSLLHILGLIFNPLNQLIFSEVFLYGFYTVYSVVIVSIVILYKRYKARYIYINLQDSIKNHVKQFFLRFRTLFYLIIVFAFLSLLYSTFSYTVANMGKVLYEKQLEKADEYMALRNELSNNSAVFPELFPLIKKEKQIEIEIYMKEKDLEDIDSKIGELENKKGQIETNLSDRLKEKINLTEERNKIINQLDLSKAINKKEVEISELKLKRIEVAKNIENSEEELDAIDKEIAELENSKSEDRKKLGDPKDIQNLEDSISKLNTKIRNKNYEADELITQKNDLHQQIEEKKDERKALERAIKTDEENREGIKQKIAREKVNNDVTESYFNELTQLADLDQSVSKLNKTIDKMEEKFQTSLANYYVIENQLARLKAELEEIQKKTEVLDDQISGGRNRLEAIDELLKKEGLSDENYRKYIEEKARIQREIEMLEEDKQNLERAIRSLKNVVANLEKDKAESVKNISNLNFLRGTIPTEELEQKITQQVRILVKETLEKEKVIEYVSESFSETITSPEPLIEETVIVRDINKILNIIITRIELSSENVIYYRDGHKNTNVMNDFQDLEELNEVFVKGSTDVKLKNRIGVLEIRKKDETILKSIGITTTPNLISYNYDFGFSIPLSKEDSTGLTLETELVIYIMDRIREGKEYIFPISTTINSSPDSLRKGKLTVMIKDFIE